MAYLEFPIMKMHQLRLLLVYTLYNIEAKEGCGIVSFDGKNYHSEKRQGLVGDHFTDPDTLKKFPGFFHRP